MQTNMRGAWELVAEQLRASLLCQETTDLNQDDHATSAPANHDHHNMLPWVTVRSTERLPECSTSYKLVWGRILDALSRT